MNEYSIGGKWLDDLNAELSGSDRACAVLAGAVLDDRVKALLQKYLHPPRNEKEDKLLGRSSPLESFSSRIELARRLNLITEETRKSLDCIRDIRNNAAHETGFSFDSHSIKDRVSNILSAMLLPERAPVLLKQPYDSPKGKFVAAVVVLVACLDIEIGETRLTVHTPTNALAHAAFSEAEG